MQRKQLNTTRRRAPLAAALLVFSLAGCGEDGSSSDAGIAGTAGTAGTGGTGSDDGAVDLPPEFSGPVQLDVMGETQMRVSWTAGSDDLTPVDQLTYNVYVAEEGETLEFTSPRAMAGSGTTQVDLLDQRDRFPVHTPTINVVLVVAQFLF